MRLISWNVNGLRAIHKKGFLDFFKSQNPDLMCLQETKCHPGQIEKELLSPFGRESFFSSAQKPGYSGVATYCLERPREGRSNVGLDVFENEGRIVWTDHGEFQLYNIYFPNGAQGPHRHDFKMSFLKELAVHLKPKVDRGEPIVLVGDYNIAHREIDIYDPVRLAGTSGFRPEERKWFDEFLSFGFTDTFRHVHGDEAHRYSWWSYFEKARPGNRGWRIDYICVTRNLVSRIRSADLLDQVHGSDHCPVLLEF